MTTLVEAHTIAQGTCFRKKGGEYVYLRISEASADFLGLHPQNVYGVCFNGNVAVVKRDTLVVPMPVAAMEANRAGQQAWEERIGAVPEVVECAWCGGECQEGEFRARSGEVFCSKSHRDASVRAVKRFHETAALARTFTDPDPKES